MVRGVAAAAAFFFFCQVCAKLHSVPPLLGHNAHLAPDPPRFVAIVHGRPRATPASSTDDYRVATAWRAPPASSAALAHTARQRLRQPNGCARNMRRACSEHKNAHQSRPQDVWDAFRRKGKRSAECRSCGVVVQWRPRAARVERLLQRHQCQAAPGTSCHGSMRSRLLVPVAQGAYTRGRGWGAVGTRATETGSSSERQALPTQRAPSARKRTRDASQSPETSSSRGVRAKRARRSDTDPNSTRMQVESASHRRTGASVCDSSHRHGMPLLDRVSGWKRCTASARRCRRYMGWLCPNRTPTPCDVHRMQGRGEMGEGRCCRSYQAQAAVSRSRFVLQPAAALTTWRANVDPPPRHGVTFRHRRRR